jgi:hypothetical protein
MLIKFDKQLNVVYAINMETNYGKNATKQNSRLQPVLSYHRFLTGWGFSCLERDRNEMY